MVRPPVGEKVQDLVGGVPDDAVNGGTDPADEIGVGLDVLGRLLRLHEPVGAHLGPAFGHTYHEIPRPVTEDLHVPHIGVEIEAVQQEDHVVRGQIDQCGLRGALMEPSADVVQEVRCELPVVQPQIEVNDTLMVVHLGCGRNNNKACTCRIDHPGVTVIIRDETVLDGPVPTCQSTVVVTIGHAGESDAHQFGWRPLGHGDGLLGLRYLRPHLASASGTETGARIECASALGADGVGHGCS